MTSYAEIAHHRKRARPFYLELCALGLEVYAEGDADDPVCFRVVVSGLKSLSEAHADQVIQRVRDNEAGLAEVLPGRWVSDLEAIRKEGGEPIR